MDTIAPTFSLHETAGGDIAMLQRLAECAMQLAERAAREALAEPATPSSSETKRGRARPDPRMVFLRLSATVRACIALKSRLAASRPPAAPGGHRQTSTDPRRHLISAFLHDAIEDSPKAKPARAEIHSAVEPVIDQYLARDTEMRHAGGQVALDICKEFEIPYDMSRMPDDLLCPPGQSVPTGYDEYLAAKHARPPAP